MSILRGLIEILIILIVGIFGFYIFYLIVGWTNILYMLISLPFWLLLGWYLTKKEEKQKSS